MQSKARTLLTIALLFGMVFTAVPVASGAPIQVKQSLPPNSISLSTIPSQLPADNSSYPAVVVSLVDIDGQPTAALTDTVISLVTSEQTVGTITSQVEIAATQTYAIANFTTTDTPGSTTVTATTIGFFPASTTVRTVFPVGYPTQLVMSAVPSTVPVGASSTGKLILQLEDEVGDPAKAITDTSISLYTSNPSVVNLPGASVVIGQGGYLLEVNYTVGSVPGPATITASAAGFASGSSTITVLGSPPLALRVDAQPSSMIACPPGTTQNDACTGRLIVALTDLQGNPSTAENDTLVELRSSNALYVTVPQTITIQKGNISATATYTVSSSASNMTGTTVTVTASAPNLQSGFATIETYPAYSINKSACESPGTQGPCRLVIYAGPNPVVADDRSYSSVVVAMAYTGGLPAVNGTSVSSGSLGTQVTLTSSVTGVGNFSSVTFYIKPGYNWVSVNFNSTFQVGNTQLTASATDFQSAQTSLETFGSAPSQIVVKPIPGDLPADGGTHPALEIDLEDSENSPAIAPFPIAVNLTSSNTAVAAVLPLVIPEGDSSILVNATTGLIQGATNVTAIESAFTTGYVTSSSVLTTVIPAPSAIAAYAPAGGFILLGQGKPVSLLAIQLQNSVGTPARARTPTNITLTPSNSTVISKVLTVEIAVGADYAMVPVLPLNTGTTTFTISSPSLTVSSITLTFLASPVVETITGGPAIITTAQSAVIAVNVAIDQQPAAGVAVSWNVTLGGLSVATVHSSSTTSTSSVGSSTSTTASSAPAQPALKIAPDKTDSSGTSTILFRSSTTGTAKIYAVISPSGFSPKVLNFTVQITAPGVVTKAKAPSLEKQLTSFPLVLAPAGGAGAAVVAVFLVRRRRSKGGEIEDIGFDTGAE